MKLGKFVLDVTITSDFPAIHISTDLEVSIFDYRAPLEALYLSRRLIRKLEWKNTCSTSNAEPTFAVPALGADKHADQNHRIGLRIYFRAILSLYLRTNCLYPTRDNHMLRPVQNTSFQIGDRLEKTDMPGQIWIVLELVTPKNDLPHAVSAYDKNPGEKRMIALSVLRDKKWYRRVQKPLPE